MPRECGAAILLLMNRIEVEGLSKAYRGGSVALSGVSFSVAEREVFGLLGPNGAGKSTALRILATILEPSGGCARVMGADVASEGARARRAFGFVPQDTAVDACLSGYENVYLHSRLHGLSRKDAKERTTEILAFMGLEKRSGERALSYSGGMRKRLDISCALIHRPSVLLLDEPTLGLDIWSRHEIWEAVDRMKAVTGVSVLLSTHYLEEADSLCDRVAILREGCIAVEGRPGELKDEAGCELVALSISGGAEAIAAAVAAMRVARGIRELRVAGGELVAAVASGETAIPLLVEAARAAGARVDRVRVERPGLEGVFMRATGGSERKEGR